MFRGDHVQWIFCPYRVNTLNPTALSYPFLRHEFLQALEDSGSACDTSGWYPVHLSLQNSNQSEEHDPTTSSEAKNAALMPLYVKTHSMGEYVFDHAWANAYHQNGLEYYPKLVTSVPFTPSTGPF